MARPKKRRPRKKVAPPPPPPPEPFPFMNLPPEIRLMVYDALMPEVVRLDGWGDYPPPPGIGALMRVKTIRDELAPHIFARYPFEWICSFKRERIHPHWYSFKRRAIPFIKSFTFAIHRPHRRSEHSTELFSTLLRWMRWRSLRSHLYPWHLKKVTLEVRPSPQPNPRLHQNLYLLTTSENGSFLRAAPIVPGLDSLTIVLYGHVLEVATEAFLEQFASCGIQGKIGYWYQNGQKLRYMAHVLEEGQIVPSHG